MDDPSAVVGKNDQGVENPEGCGCHNEHVDCGHVARVVAEWTKSSIMEVQYHGIKEGAGLETWRAMSYQTVLTPPELKTGNVIYPYEKAK